MHSNTENKKLTKGLTFLLALAGGIAVANLYYNQPLLSEIADTFHISSRAAGFLATFTQLGYAMGVFLFVPLGDIKEKRRLILILNSLVTLSLIGVTMAQNINMLYLFCFIVGLTTVTPQIILPLASQLSEPEERGKVIGTIVSGLLIGILLARTLSGYIGYLSGWRIMFGVAAVLMCLLTILLYSKLPVAPSNSSLKYHELIRTVVNMPYKYKALRKSAITQAMVFGSFSLFWTTLTFLLQSPAFHMNSNQVGLFGLFGVVGALGARVVGRLNDKRDSRVIVNICVIVCILAYLILLFSSTNVIGIILGVIVLDFGVQGSQVTNQSIIYSLSNDEASRINTIFVVSCFIGGALGSSLGSIAWNLYQWHGVCIVGIVMISIVLLINLPIKVLKF